MHDGAIPLSRLIGRRRHPCLLHQVLGEHAHGLLDLARLGIHLHLSALAKEFFQHLLGDGLATGFVLRIARRAQLVQHLHQFRLEVPAELHLLRRLVVLLAPFLGTLLPLASGFAHLLQKLLQFVVVELALFIQILGFGVARVLLLVGYADDDVVRPQSRLRRILDGGGRVLQASQHSGQHPGRRHMVLGQAEILPLLQTQAHQELDHCLAHGHLLHGRATRQRLALHTPIGTGYARVVGLHPVVQSTVLEDGEDVQGETPLVEQGEEPPHVGEPAPFRRSPVPVFRPFKELGFMHGLGNLLLPLFGAPQTLIGKEDRRPLEHEAEAVELQVGHLVRRHHLEPVEVLPLVGVLVHQFRQIDLGAFGGSLRFGNPPDALTHKLLGVEYLHRFAGEGPAVETHHAPHPVQFQAG